MKIICTTSDKYLHLLPVFSYLFNKYWPGQEAEVVGYRQPHDLPENFSFHSMGTQGHVNEWSTDLRKYFETQETGFIWLMEDTFLKAPVDNANLELSYAILNDHVGRIDLTCDLLKRDHESLGYGYTAAKPGTKYRQSTQPSIWNKEFLLKYLTDGLDPWQFETQATDDEYMIVGLETKTIFHNEGVRRFDPLKLDLKGMDKEDINHIKKISTWLK